MNDRCSGLVEALTFYVVSHIQQKLSSLYGIAHLVFGTNSCSHLLKFSLLAEILYIQLTKLNKAGGVFVPV